MLIRILITALFGELPSASTRVRHTRAVVAAHPLELKHQDVERPNLQGVSNCSLFQVRRVLVQICLQCFG